jgi:ribonuclease G
VRTDSRTGNRSSPSANTPTQNDILINASAGETRVAIREHNSFIELHIERDTDRSVAGAVMLGRVTRVLPGMQAAFVDIGLEKAAFLYVGDYLDASDQLEVELAEENDTPRPRRGHGRNGNNRQSAKIETLLREGQEIVVQVAKDPIGTKGARITSHVSIAGRHLVLTPWAQRVGVSRRIESDRERRRLRELVSRLRPRDLGFIIRTAGEGAREADVEADVKYLTSVWDDIQIRKDQVSAPVSLYSELSLPLRVIRDFANSKTKRIVVDSEPVFEEMKSFLSRFVADPKPRLEHYRGAEPIFDHFEIESHIDVNLGKKVWLKSGGYLIVDQSEALTAIDVNTGRYVGKHDLEETVLKTNLEAVKEIVHQLRFRNIGGLIIIDLIDMESGENREKVYRALQETLRLDKAKSNILKISELGLVEMTRKRTRENLVQQLCEPCSYCEGRGYLLSRQSVAFKVLREIRKDLPRFCGRQIAVAVNPHVAEVLLGPLRKTLATLSSDLGREIEIRARPGLHQEQFEVTALDEGPPIEISLSWLRERKPDEEAGETGVEEVVPWVIAAVDIPRPEPEAGAAPAEETPAAAAEPAEGAEAPTEDSAEQAEAFAEKPAEEEAPQPPVAPAILAAPTEVVDAEAESPILPRPQETEES